MRKFLLLISISCFLGSHLFAQNTTLKNNSSEPATRTCGTMDNVSQQNLDALEDFLAPKIAEYLSLKANGGSPEAVYNIPTVVHVIHNTTEGVGSGRNISNLKIQQQMTILNDDFRRTNSDADGTWSQAIDCEINFCLIEKYPSLHANAGQLMPEPGVDRVSTANISGISNTSSGYSMNTVDNSIKPATSWNPNEVMNIWVCQLQGGLLGYATFPSSGPANEDGTVMGYQYFGITSGAYGLGRTTTHEVGHWLGLYHIWGDDFGGCGGSDQVSDTPNQANSTGGCPSGVRTDACASSSPGYMYQNYMDYTNDACMNLFTDGQKSRMQAVMSSSQRRSTLNGFSATLCSSVGIDDVSLDHSITISPNPARNVINVAFTDVKNVNVEVFNMLGEILFHKENINSTNISIDMTAQPNGIYFVKVKSKGNSTTEKIMIVK